MIVHVSYRMLLWHVKARSMILNLFLPAVRIVMGLHWLAGCSIAVYSMQYLHP